MNIFCTDINPGVSAQNLQYHKLIRKMPTESYQMLCTAFWHFGIEAPYKPFNPMHECNVWVRESEQNFLWLLDHAQCIDAIYFEKFGKQRNTKIGTADDMFNWVLSNFQKLKLPPIGLTMPFLAMKNSAPDLVRDCGEPVEIRSPYSGKVNLAYRALSLEHLCNAYRTFLTRKPYWSPSFYFQSSNLGVA